MKLGNTEIKGKVALAPMAGVADRAFRELCVSYGASYVVSEMVSSKGMYYKDKKSAELMTISDLEQPAGIQIFGSEPEIMAIAAKQACEFNPVAIDINMGCPAPKVSSNGAGSALLKNPKLCGDIVKAVVNAVDLPVTVKIRKGWDANSITGLEVAKYCEDNGASAITVHGRTREQMYSPTADWDFIAKIKENMSIPVIGNGDIFEPYDAVRMFEHTNCDMVMIGRSACGNPWIFSGAVALLESETILPTPTISQRMVTMCKHIEKIVEYKGELNGMKEARKHITWYLKDFNGAASFRKEAGYISTLPQLYDLVKRVVEQCHLED